MSGPAPRPSLTRCGAARPPGRGRHRRRRRCEARLLLAHAIGPRARPRCCATRPRRRRRPASTPLLARRAGARAAGADPRAAGVLEPATSQVSPATLIPRADSETLIEAALAARPGRRRCARAGPRHRHRLPAAGGADRVPRRLGRRRSTAARRRRRWRPRNARALGLADRARSSCADWAAPLARPVRPGAEQPALYRDGRDRRADAGGRPLRAAARAGWRRGRAGRLPGHPGGACRGCWRRAAWPCSSSAPGRPARSAAWPRPAGFTPALPRGPGRHRRGRCCWR